MDEICERCDSGVPYWHIAEAGIRCGELNRKPRLCRDCTHEVQEAIRAALRPKGREGVYMLPDPPQEEE